MIIVLRLGHRCERDKRLSTHVGLTARAFGADKIVYSGEKDSSLLSSVKRVAKRWGGSFQVGYEKGWRNFLQKKKSKGFKVIHLTMYGEDFGKTVKKLKGDLLLVVGGPKVPGDLYGTADFNVSVGNQPHSEVAALALVLDRVVDWQNKKFPDAELEVRPCPKGKLIVKR